MASSTPNERAGAVTVLLARLQRGDRAALSELMDALYPELRTLARALLRSERPNHSLQPTALVNEAYIRLVGHRAHNWEHRAHFFGAAAQLMRRVLVDYARARLAHKRGGNGVVVTVDVAEAADVSADAPSLEVLALDQALADLARVSQRQARIVELRYFGGLSVPETAEALGMNARTVDRDWAAARVWLRRRLRS
jgi:RNA polymerase sigma factor (TIGR02999 family)